jgi:hypothetical protein
MWNMNDVIKIEYRGGFVYRIVFDDGKSGNVDFSEYVGRGPVFEPLRDKVFFQKATIEVGESIPFCGRVLLAKADRTRLGWPAAWRDR